ncbi:MAG: preprotein translocase subunit YajC [Proteobacteria bacterium]|nr:preprotein translocase subunit YajC [Pseudomonadota bacterium]
MDFFISSAWAQDGAAQQNPMTSVFFIVILFVVFYFMLIRPQQKRAKQHKTMIGALNSGDEVVTNGGILGKLTDVGEHFVTVEIADGTSIKLQRQAVATVLPKGTIKSA